MVEVKNKVQEVDAIRAKIVALTKAKFENVKPDSLPRLQGKAKWVLQCSDLKRISHVRYLNTVWEDSEGSIWMESLSLGDNIEWIEDDYGEEGVEDAEGMALNLFVDEKYTKELQAKFPLVAERLAKYRTAAREYSKQYGVDLRMNYFTDGVAVFLLCAKVGTAAADLPKKLEAIQRTLNVMKAALTEINDYETHRRG